MADVGGEAFSDELEELLRWPYSIHAIDETLDPEMIDGTGRQLLFQALNTKELVAFVGSGVSVAYGRMGWQQWLEHQLTETENRTKALLESIAALQMTVRALRTLLNIRPYIENIRPSIDAEKIEEITVNIKKSGPPKKVSLSESDAVTVDLFLELRDKEYGYIHSQLKRLLRTFSNLRQKGDGVGGDKYPVVFQVAERLQAMTSQWIKHFEPAVSNSASSPYRRCFGHQGPEPLRLRLEAIENRLLSLISNKRNLSELDYTDLLSKRSSLAVPVQQYLISAIELLSKRDKHRALLNNESSSLPFEDQVKTMFLDELAAAEKALIDGLKEGKQNGRGSLANRKPRAGEREHQEPQQRVLSQILGQKQSHKTSYLKRDFAGIRTDPQRFEMLSYFKTEAFKRIIADIHGKTKSEFIRSTHLKPWLDVLKSIEGELDDNLSDISPFEQKLFVSPIHRYVLTMLLQLLESPLDTLSRTLTPNNENLIRHKLSVRKRDFGARRLLIDAETDPLLHLSSGLGIRRFLTTNYDIEIERLFADAGYQEFVRGSVHDAQRGTIERSPGIYRVNALGGRFLDASFERSRVAELHTFTLGREDADAGVFHLHGRATDDSKCIVTERDYMERYLRNDEYRETVDEGIRLTFSANPILFVGLGMSEADILRPLREFMSDNAPRSRRTALLLYASTGSEVEQAQTSAMLYVRYGVHTIFYGRAWVLARLKGNSNRSEPYRFNWLGGVIQLIKWLRIQNESLLKQALASLKGNGHFKPDPNIKYGQPALDSLSETLGNPRIDPQPNAEALENTNVLSMLLGINKSALPKLLLKSTKFESLTACHFGHSAQAPGIRYDLYEQISKQVAKQLQTPTAPEEGKKDQVLAFERRLLAFVLHETLTETPIADLFTPSSRTSKRKQLAYIRALKARLTALDGVESGIRTGTLCASLEGLREDWQQWWEDWRMEPQHRQARFQTFAFENDDKERLELPVRCVRHQLQNVITQLDHCHQASQIPTNKDFQELGRQTRTGVRMFDSFIDSLQRLTELSHQSAKNRISSKGRLSSGRRMHLICAIRGMGKGSTLSAFMTPRGLSNYILASWPALGYLTESGKSMARPTYISAIYINLSFSTEITSCYDMLVDALEISHRCLERIEPGDLSKRPPLATAWKQGKIVRDKEIGDEKKAIDAPRLQHLKRALGKFSALATAYIDAQTEHKPNTPAVQPRVLIAISAIDLLYRDGGRAKNREIEEFLGFLASDEASEFPFDFVAVSNETRLGPPFVLPPTSPIVSRLKFVPIVRPKIFEKPSALHAVQRRERSSPLTLVGYTGDCESSTKPPLPVQLGTDWPALSDSSVCTVYFSRPAKPERLLIDNFLPLAMLLNLKFRLEKSQLRNKPLKLSVKLANNELKQPHPNWDHLNSAWKNLASNLVQFRKTKPEWGISLDEHNLNQAKLNLEKRYSISDEAALREWRQIRETLHSNRFCLTIILAAAQRIALTKQDVVLAARAAELFIRQTVDHIATVSAGRQEHTAIRNVLLAHEKFHRHGDERADINLHQCLLKHLAVIGSPVGADVLVWVPEIRAYFEQIEEHYTRSRQDRLRQALQSLCDYGLTFRVEPYQGLSRKDANGSPGDIGYTPHRHARYALHRLVSGFSLERLGAGARDLVEINEFGPTLYASMPSEVPRLRPEAYRFLRELVQSLSQYPDRLSKDSAFNLLPKDSGGRNTRVQALRAALGVIRNTFSVAVVSRFEDYPEISPEKERPPRGYFELYRIELRWLLRKAFELRDRKLQAPDEGRLFGTLHTMPADGQIQPFYRDEIVWLYNECAVVCLVQGNLRDSAALLRQGIKLNRAIEGDGEDGAQHNRLALNLAVVQIERGNLSAARQRLQRIMSTEEKGPSGRGRVWHIARGYLALTDLIAGHRDAAASGLQEAIEFLAELRDSRACAVFCLHRGNASRLSGQTGDGRTWLDRSIGYAESGGHEDLHKRARLARIHCDLLDAQHENRATTHETARQLQLVEEYGELMEMPSLIFDVLWLRALMMVRYGDINAAGDALTHAMAIAKRGQMNLRLNSAMRLYANLLHARGLRSQARHMLFACLEFAKRTGNQGEIARIETDFQTIDTT